MQQLSDNGFERNTTPAAWAVPMDSPPSQQQPVRTFRPRKGNGMVLALWPAALAVAVSLLGPASAPAQSRPVLRPMPPMQRPTVTSQPNRVVTQPPVVGQKIYPEQQPRANSGNGNLGGTYVNLYGSAPFQGGGFGSTPANLKPDGWKTVYQSNPRIIHEQGGRLLLKTRIPNPTGGGDLVLPLYYSQTRWIAHDSYRFTNWYVIDPRDGGTITPIDIESGQPWWPTVPGVESPGTQTWPNIGGGVRG